MLGERIQDMPQRLPLWFGIRMSSSLDEDPRRSMGRPRRSSQIHRMDGQAASAGRRTGRASVAGAGDGADAAAPPGR